MEKGDGRIDCWESLYEDTNEVRHRHRYGRSCTVKTLKMIKLSRNEKTGIEDSEAPFQAKERRA